MQEVKRALRKELISRRKAMNAEEKSKADDVIFEKLVNSCEFINAELVLLYVSTEIEVDTRRLIDYCIMTGKRVAAPVSLDTELLFKEFASVESLKKGRYDIYEPDEDCESITDFKKSLCIVPALSVNTDGYRIGYGKGYYDRFLSAYDGASACLCYKDFIGNVPIDKYDVKPDFIITD